ncbi:hypothetical protein HC928_20835 [bacterium]|nr:hypothetical protein [bacterium]
MTQQQPGSMARQDGNWQYHTGSLRRCATGITRGTSSQRKEQHGCQ